MVDVQAVKKLPRRRMDAVVALVSYPNIREAAKSAGIGENTMYRWLRDPTFQEAYREAKYQVVQQALSQLQEASGEAARALRAIVNDPEISPHTRVTAARTILETAIRAVEIDTLEARIQRLEQYIEEQTPSY